MKLPTTTFDLSRQRMGGLTQGLPATLPAHATRRPGLMEQVFASRAEREILRDREAAAVAVEREQVSAATEVAIARTRNVAELSLKSLTVESDRSHHELETQMQKNGHEAERVQASLVTHIATDCFTAEKSVLDQVKAMEAAGELAPDRAQVLAEIVKANTERVVQTAVSMHDIIGNARRGRTMRALSVKD